MQSSSNIANVSLHVGMIWGTYVQYEIENLSVFLEPAPCGYSVFGTLCDLQAFAIS